MRSTYTYAVMDISPSAYQEIRAKLEAAGYGHALHRSADGAEVLDMHGIALGMSRERDTSPRVLLTEGKRCAWCGHGVHHHSALRGCRHATNGLVCGCREL